MPKFLLALVALAGVGGGIMAWQMHSFGARRAERAANRARHGFPDAAKLDAEARETLRRARARIDSVDDAELGGALTRLGAKRDPEAREVALRAALDPSHTLRAAAADCLGNFDDDAANAALARIARDPEAFVRLRAVRAMGSVASPARAALLEGMLKDGATAAAERAQLALSILRAGARGPAENAALETLLRIAADPAEPAAAALAGLGAVERAPSDPRVRELLRASLRPDGNPRIRPVAVRHLAAAKDAWYLEHLDEVAALAAPEVRSAAIDSLPQSCSPARFTLIERALRSPASADGVRLIALRTVSQFRGDEPKRLLEAAVASGSLSREEKAEADRGLLRLKLNGGADPCAAPAKGSAH